MQARSFMGLTLDSSGLHTPNGTLELSRITRAEVVRHRSRELGDQGTEHSPEAIVGGAVVGGAVFGTAGAVAGGLLGSTVEREKPHTGDVPRTVSADLVFESPDLSYKLTVGKLDAAEAEAFAAAVKDAAGLS